MSPPTYYTFVSSYTTYTPFTWESSSGHGLATESESPIGRPITQPSIPVVPPATTTANSGLPTELLQALGKWMGEIRSHFQFKEIAVRGCSVEQQLRLMKKVHATSVSTNQPRSQFLELLQALGKWMGEIRSHFQFKEIVVQGCSVEQQLKLMKKVLYIKVEKPSCI